MWKLRKQIRHMQYITDSRTSAHIPMSVCNKVFISPKGKFNMNKYEFVIMYIYPIKSIIY